MSEAWRRRGLFVAGALNVLGGVSALAAFFVDVVWPQRTERQREAQRLVTA